MKTARIIFLIAAVYGLAVMFLLPVMPKWVGSDGARSTAPVFYFGFISVTIAWQFVFLLIAINPARYRPLMLLAALAEKFLYVGMLSWLMITDQAPMGWSGAAVADGLLGVAFLWAWWKTPGTKAAGK